MHAHTMTSPYHPSLSLGPFDLETKNDRNTKTMTSPTPSFEGPPPNQCLFQVVRHTVQFTLRVGDGMVELGPDAAESAQAQPFYFAEDLWSGRFFL